MLAYLLPSFVLTYDGKAGPKVVWAGPIGIICLASEVVFFILAMRNEALWLRKDELQVTNWLGRVSLRIPYSEIDSFRNDSYQPRYEYFALITNKAKVRIPGDFPKLAELSHEIQVRRLGQGSQPYPQFLNDARGRRIIPPPAYTYAVWPVAVGLATTIALALARVSGLADIWS